MKQTVIIRPARLSDLDAIFVILREVASRIPTNLSTPEHVNEMHKQIKESYFDGFSIVATDVNGAIVGFQLSQKQHWFEETYVKLAYAGVTAAFENKGIFRRLIEAMKQHSLPLVAEVLPGNKSAMSLRLERYGFERVGDTYRWQP
jgi:hypothetical protein